MWKKVWWFVVLLVLAAGLEMAWGQTNLSRPEYEVVLEGMVSGALLYMDRTYTMITVPLEMVGGSYIKTANDDKYNPSFWSFDISTPMTVYVCHDGREPRRPIWLVGRWDW